MRLRPWWSWARALVLVVLGLGLLSPARARADGSAEPPGENERVVKIGPQAVVIVNERGKARMYDDPSEQERVCKTNLGCIARGVGVIAAGFSVLTYIDLTLGYDVSGRGVPPAATPRP